MADPAKVEDQNILPVQALFNLDNSFNTFIGQGQPFVVSATESIGIQDVTALNATLYPTLSPVSTGQVTSLDVTSTKLTFNPYTGVLSAPEFDGVLNGNAAHATNLSNGSAGQIPYQTSPGNTSFISNGTTGQVLTSNGSSAPTWTTPTFFAAVTDDTTTNATRYPLFAAQTSGSLTTEYTSSTKYQFNPSTGVLTATQFSGSGAGLTGTASSLSIGGNAVTSTTATNIVGGANGSIPYQTGSGATTMLAAGTNGQILTLSGGVPSWVSASTSTIAISDDTTTNATRYITFTSATTGSISGENVSSTKLQYNPSTGTLTTTAFSCPSVTITGGSINGANIGGSVAGDGTFDVLTANVSRLGNASGDNFNIGTLTYTPANALISSQSSVSTYNQIILQNSNTGTSASADYIVNNSNSTDTTYYGDFGMNSSGFTGSGAFNQANNVYLTATTADLAIGTTTSNAIHFVVNGGATDAMTISSAGLVSASSVAITGGSINGTTIGGTTPAAGTFTTLTLSGAGNNFFGDFSNATLLSRNAFKTSTTNGSTGIYALPNGTSTAASWQATNAADPTNASKVLIATNGSTDVQLVSGINGTGTYLPLGLYNGGAKQVEVASVPSAVNYIQLKGSATTLEPVITATGTDTNVPIAFVTKGTGAIDLAAGSSGVNISNGGTVTALTVANAGTSAYTTIPSVAITAPTTAGGVQATSSATMRASTGSTTLASGGAGYTVGDVLTLSGGTFSGVVQITVNTVTAGAVATFTVSSAGSAYSVLPTNPVSVTGGTGSGATFNVLWFVNTLNITNAGSGYVEQPTVSFSGGGGSGAAAYATVGTNSVLRGVGPVLSFYTPGGEQVRVADSNSTSVNYVNLKGAATGSTPTVFSGGTDTNIALSVYSKGSSPIQFLTNNGAQLQFNVSHTASAVNYVQVTGSATGGISNILFTGSDAAVTGAVYTKGAGSFSFYSNAGANRQVRIDGSTAAVNYLDLYGAIASSAPSVRVGGSDTNIDLTLTPKGTGSVKTTANAYVGSNLYIAP